MIGIYKITNKINGKIYIGQSQNCERRFKEHCYPNRFKNGYPIDVAIHKYGKENFSFEIIEECKKEELNLKETYWIQYYQSNTSKGYNCNIGGEQFSIGENNGNSKVTEEDVKQIRLAYSQHQSKKDTYKLVQDRITFSSFESIWEGRTWIHVMPEVYTLDNKKFYATGENCINNQIYTNEEIIEFRKQYVNKTAKEIYEALEAPLMTFQSFQKMLNGTSFKNLPYYSKTYKKWFEPNEIAPKTSTNRGKHQSHSGLFTDEEVMKYRALYVDKTAQEIYLEFKLKDIITLDSFSKMLRGVNYGYLPYYSKKQKKWINQ